MKPVMQILICLGSHNKWYGRLVRFILGCTFNHAFIAYRSSDWDRWMAVEVLDHVYVVPLDRTLKRYLDFRAYQCLTDLTDGFRSMHSYLGADYDWKGMLGGLGRALLWRFFGWKSARPFHNTSRLFCTECVADVLKNSGVVGTENWETWRIGPGMLESFLSSNPCCTVLEREQLFKMASGR